MLYRTLAINLLILSLTLISSCLIAQEKEQYLFSGVVFNQKMQAIPYTHVIAHGSGQGDMTDNMGRFNITVNKNDRLSFLNVAYRDTSVLIAANTANFYIKLESKIYQLKEAKIFDWGSSYEDMMAETKKQGAPESLGDKMSLPKQDPFAIPFDLDEKKIKSGKFLVASPISYLYYNNSKYEKSRRKANQLSKNQEAIRRFEELLSPENLGEITGLQGEELEGFIIYLNQRFLCSYRCSEIEIISEIYKVWKYYEEIM